MMGAYLLHFSTPYKHARHYIGWSRYIDKRIMHHVNGTGAKLLRAVSKAGIEVIKARVWEGRDGNFERRLHNYKSAADLCPICNPNATNRMRG